jgi:cytoskeletal protein RodZ
LPTGSVGRGFLRLYARYLGVDVEQAVKLYEEESKDLGDQTVIAEVGAPRYVDYRPLEVDLMEPGASGRWPRLLASILIIGLLVAALWWLLNARAANGPISLLAPQPTPTATSTATRWVVTATPAPTQTAVEAQAAGAVGVMETPLPALTSDLLLLPTPTVPPTITPTPRPTATPEVVDAGLTLDAEAIQRSWLRVFVDGQLAEESVLRAGETRSWTAAQSIYLRTGNAGGLLFALNGEDLGALGDVGQVVERTWILDQGQVNEFEGDAAASLPTPTPTATPAG